MSRRVCRGTLSKVIKKNRSALRLTRNLDLLVHMNLLMFLHRLAEESRVKAFEKKSLTIKPEHIFAVVKKVLKKSKG
ncbi:centromere protein W [Lissotriton helveticus]